MHVHGSPRQLVSYRNDDFATHLKQPLRLKHPLADMNPACCDEHFTRPTLFPTPSPHPVLLT